MVVPLGGRPQDLQTFKWNLRECTLLILDERSWSNLGGRGGADMRMPTLSSCVCHKRRLSLDRSRCPRKPPLPRILFLRAHHEASALHGGLQLFYSTFFVLLFISPSSFPEDERQSLFGEMLLCHKKKKLIKYLYFHPVSIHAHKISSKWAGIKSSHKTTNKKYKRCIRTILHSDILWFELIGLFGLFGLGTNLSH